jgi:molybdopterin-guanine dinucleotide biosynthesis protein A
VTIKENEDLYGLVLAGGRSSRMGFDKGLIEYRKMPHRLYLYELLNKFCARTFLGLRPDQQEEAGQWPLILDKENYGGPFRSILAAHEAHPSKAWLVVACDLPFLGEASIRKLIEGRDRSKAATTFYNQQKGFPEPLSTIWEPEGLRQARRYASQGQHSPGRFLESVDCKLIMTENEKELINVNDPDQWEQARKALE